MGGFFAPKCADCGKAATVHISNVAQGQKRDLHLCRECAEKEQLLRNEQLNVALVVQRMIGPSDESSGRKEPP
jgi:protein-arginine kinase activator protein McsA